MAASTPGMDARLYTAAYSTTDRVEPEPESPDQASAPDPSATIGRRLSDSTLAEAYLVYRCENCGRVGDLRTFPNRCLDCSGPRERIHYEIED